LLGLINNQLNQKEQARVATFMEGIGITVGEAKQIFSYEQHVMEELQVQHV
jgi:hypothetical protein